MGSVVFVIVGVVFGVKAAAAAAAAAARAVPVAFFFYSFRAPPRGAILSAYP
jgi:hypothetical protein